jgi:hypothetical protein
MNRTVASPTDTKFTRKELSEALAAAGYRMPASTLATLASRGGGPPFTKFGKWPLYSWSEALAWAKARETPPMRSASERPSAA